MLIAVACIASYVVAGERGIYRAQRLDTPKTTTPTAAGAMSSSSTPPPKQRRHWLPAPAALQGPDDEATG